jgi:endonuclease I
MYQGDIPAGEEAVLRQWATDDPPDARERRRQEETAVAQGSRNPFIDYPHLHLRIADL